MSDDVIRYRRERFRTRLPTDRLYTPSHHWLLETEPGLWRIGLTGFATRMLGDLVEYELKVPVGAPVEEGATIGWIEGFKALSDLYCVARGAFAGENPSLAKNVTLLDRKSYGDGWLYAVEGTPAANGFDVHTYVATLDATIDRMLEDQTKPPDE